MGFYRGMNLNNSDLELYIDFANPKSYVSGNSVVNDLSGNGHIGTLINAPTFDGNNKGSLHFNGTTQFVNMGGFSEYIVNGSITTTVEMWTKPIVADAIYFGGQNLSGERLYIGVNNGKWSFGLGDRVYVSSGLVVKKVEWTHIVLSINNGVGSLYINGDLSESKSDTAVNLVGDMTFGCYYANGFAGTSSEHNTSILKIFNRALGVDEVIHNYNSLKGRYL